MLVCIATRQQTGLLTEQILKTKEVVTKTWTDQGGIKGREGGQFLYDMRMNFGNESLDRLKKTDGLDECIPDTGAASWDTSRQRKQDKRSPTDIEENMPQPTTKCINNGGGSV